MLVARRRPDCTEVQRSDMRVAPLELKTIGYDLCYQYSAPPELIKEEIKRDHAGR